MITTSRRASWAAVLLALPAVLLPASTAAAEESDAAGVDVTGNAGCVGAATSLDADGGHLGFLSTKTGTPASQDAPLGVAQDGAVEYAWSSQRPIVDNTWTVSLGGIQISSGRAGNAEGGKPVQGVVQVSDHLQVPVTGLMKAEVEITGNGSVGCTATAWIELEGNGWTSGDGLLGMAFIVLGLIGLGFSRPVPAHGSPGGVRSHGAKGAVFGALAGLGLGVLLISLAVIPFGSIWTLLAVAGGGLVVGLLFGKYMPARGGAAV